MEKICVICGRPFESHHGIEVCSSSCFTTRKHISDANSNLRRRNRESGTPILKKCPVCGKNFEGLRNKYCSAECTQAAHLANMKLYNKYYYKKSKEAKKMTVSEMREALHISRAEFSRKYNIPLRTLENWESGVRTPPAYVVSLLERAVLEDVTSGS